MFMFLYTFFMFMFIHPRFEGAEAAHSIIAAGPEPLQSQFTTSYSLVLNLLSVYSLDQAREFLRCVQCVCGEHQALLQKCVYSVCLCVVGWGLGLVVEGWG